MGYNRKLLFVNPAPNWNTPEGALGTINNNTAITPIQLSAPVRPVGTNESVTYAVTSGALPTGLSLSSGGEITGTPTGYSSQTTVNFSITATDSTGDTSTRNFNFIVAVIYSIDFLVVAGGGGAGYDVGGGGGAGGLRTSYGATSGGGASSESALSVFAGNVYIINVGNGGASSPNTSNKGSSGGNSFISLNGTALIESLGGGGGGSYPSLGPGLNGGSGGGGGHNGFSGGAGTAGQGYAGGSSSATAYGSGGGGGAGGAGSNGVASNQVAGGAPLAVSITGSSVNYAGGGYGNADSGAVNGTGYNTSNSFVGYYGFGANGTGAPNANPNSGANGIVILRMPTVSYSGIITGSPGVATSGSDTILTYTGSGTYTA